MEWLRRSVIAQSMVFESESCGMNSEQIPVILVHGWNSHPGIWKRLCQRLDAAKIPYYKFDHSGMQTSSLEEISIALADFIQNLRKDHGYEGKIDIVCHSIGTCIARYFLEVRDGSTHQEKIRQLIGIGPPNNGSALAELFFNPEYGPGIIRQLNGVFVPQGFDPSADPLVRDVRPASRTMQQLRLAGIRKDISYHMIVTANPFSIPAFFPFFEGKTYESSKSGGYFMTGNGDGIVTHTESTIPGVSLDIIPADQGDTMDMIPIDHYCHINLLRNIRVLERIMEYLTDNEPVKDEENFSKSGRWVKE